MLSHAHEILEASTAAEAKEIASRVPRYLHKDWHQIKLSVMKEILHAKADYSPLFKSTLVDSAGHLLVESTQDLFWSSGLPPHLSVTTKPSFHPGRNQLGRLLSTVREEIIKESILTVLIDTDCSDDVNFPPSSPSEIEEDAQAVPSPKPNDDQCNVESTPTTPVSTKSSVPTSSSLSTTSTCELPDCIDVLSAEQNSDSNLNVGASNTMKTGTGKESTKTSTSEDNSVKGKNNSKKPTKQISITAHFESIGKRKLSPEKEADLARDNQKVQRGNISEL